MQGSRLVGGAALALVLFLVPTTALGARHVYVSNLQSPATANVAGYTLASNGELTPNGAPAGTTDFGPEGVVSAPDGGHLYAAISNSPATVSSLAVAADGTLSPGTTTPAGGNQAEFTAMAPDGAHLYVQLAGSSTLSVLGVNVNGSLTSQASGIAAGTAPTGLAVAPNGNSLYAADFNLGGPGSIVRFTIGADGNLTPQGATPTGGLAADQMTITPDGRYLYVTNANSKDVSGFAINATTGALTPAPGSPFPTGSADFAEAITATADGSHLYVANTERSISGWNIDPANGSLSAAPGSPFVVSSSSNHAALTTSPDGKQLVETLNSSSSLNSYAIAADGALTAAASISSGGLNPDFQSVLSRPNQPATAAFTTKPLAAGKVHFDANASKDPDGKVSIYRWDFGDGSPVTDLTKAGADHVYTLAGTYRAKLTTIDNEGCSTELVFTGQSALCNGSRAASLTKNLSSSVQFTLSAGKRQRTRFVRATGFCPTEACNVNLGGSAKIGGRKLSLPHSSRGLDAGAPRTWRLRLPRRAVKALSAGKAVSLRLTAAAKAATGQGRTTSRSSSVLLRSRHRRQHHR